MMAVSHLVWSIKIGDLEQVHTVFQEKLYDVNSELEGRYALHYAADYGQHKVLEYLITRGANPNVYDKHGITPLLAAVWEGHTKCVELLLEKGADRSGHTPDGRTYLEVAANDDVRYLLRNAP